MAKTPRIKNYNAQHRDVYTQNRTHTGRRKMLTPGTRIAMTITATIIFAIIGYLVVVVGFRMIAQLAIEFGKNMDEGQSLADISPHFSIGWPTVKEWIAIAIWSLIWGLMFANFFKRNLESQNAMNDTSDINEYEDDQYIATPEEIMAAYAFFPDMGAHADIQVSTLISHVMITNKGINKIQIADRAESDIKDEDGDVVYRKGEQLEDDDGNILKSNVPMFDLDFAKKVYETASVADEFRMPFDVRNVPYNPGKKAYGKLPYETASELINGAWTFPEYEVQRPTGAYLVDTDPVNTMVIASTRAGKGQTIIEPTIDMWTREKRLNNIVVNDPKGELTVKFYEPATVRGYDVIQFNLINAMKTDIYNPLALAANAAREGDFTKCAAYTENIADVFFPVDGAEDPVWPNAANNAFKRAVYGMIDFYMEAETEMREEAVNNTDISQILLETKIDQLWGHVTLYNCYQMFVRLSSKKVTNPVAEVKAMQKEAAAAAAAGEPPKYGPEEMQAKIISANRKGILWNNAPDVDALTLYFNSTSKLPTNGIRSLTTNAHNALLAMGGADKMIASVYGIAITAMSFFTDPTISTLTSGSLSQNIDLAACSFPRRIGIRFHSDFMRQEKMAGTSAFWDSYEDKEFTKVMDKEFHHEGMVNREGWAKYCFEGIYPNDTAYIKLEIKDTQSGLLRETFYFMFEKAYQKTFDGKHYIQNPILNERIVKNGVLYELHPKTKAKRHSSFKRIIGKSTKRTPKILQTSINYCEKPKMIFFITPPHLLKYAKLSLIAIKQLVDLNFDQSYTTKENQKPLYKTRYMLDELGNLQSDGHGIAGFQTMLSIGLGQDQQFTLILQTLQQLKDVYGDSVDKIIQGNTANIIFLKSPDDTLLETLSKMSGTRHVAYTDSKTINRDLSRMHSQTDERVSYTMATKEVPLISYNDMANIATCNSMIFRIGGTPIWNRNQMALPMSHCIHKNQINVSGKKFTLLTVPTTSSALEFDLTAMVPDFDVMLEQRLSEFEVVDDSKMVYKEQTGLTDSEINRMDADVYASEIMSIAKALVKQRKAESETQGKQQDMLKMIENEDIKEVLAEENAKHAEGRVKRYADGMLSREDIIKGSYIDIFYNAFMDTRNDWKNNNKVVCDNSGLRTRDGRILIDFNNQELKAFGNNLAKAANEDGNRVYSESENADIKSVDIRPEFITWLCELDSWPRGFDMAVAKAIEIQ